MKGYHILLQKQENLLWNNYDNCDFTMCNTYMERNGDKIV